MANTSTMKKISTGKKRSTISGPGYGSTINQYVFRTVKPYFAQGRNTVSKSATKHMTEQEAERYSKTLP